MWSGNSYFQGKNGECTETLQTNTLIDFILSRGSENPLTKFTRADQSTELVVVWIQPEAAMSNYAYSFLEPVLAGAASSLVVPFVYRDSFTPSISATILNNFKPEATKIVASSNKPDAVALNQLLDHLKQNNGIFTNGIADLVLVYLDTQPDDGALISAVDQLVKEQTGGQYVSFYTSDAEYVPPEKTRTRREAYEEETTTYARAARSTDYGTSTYWPKGVWEGLLVAALLLVILSVGLWCTYELQTPTKWERDHRRQDH